MSTRRRQLAALAALGVIALLAAPPGGAASSPAPRVLVAAVAPARPAPPAVTCGACIVVTESGRVLYGRAQRQPRSNASTTKMLTALVVVRMTELDDTVTVSPTAAATGGGGLDLAAGERQSVRNLLYALLLTSSNDAAVALAEHVAGSEAAFVGLMNHRARRLGATESRFVTAHGLDVPGHYSTARDLATIGAAVLAHPELRAMVATPETVIVGSGGTDHLENRNLLLETYRGAVGIKTGYTAQAGNVLVAAARRRHRTLIAVTMGSVDATEDARRLLDYGWSRLAQTLLLPAGAPVGVLVLPSGHSTPIIAAEEVRGFADRARVEVDFEPRPGAPAPGVGDILGRVEVTAGLRTIASVDAVAADGVRSRTSSWPAVMLGAILKTAAGVTGRL